MQRTKLKDRKLPDYTRGEEIFNMVSHIVGGAFGIVALHYVKRIPRFKAGNAQKGYAGNRPLYRFYTYSGHIYPMCAVCFEGEKHSLRLDDIRHSMGCLGTWNYP